ncbi:uncharacterized mitochondrial protein-like protein [Tanacetum coccineum]
MYCMDYIKLLELGDILLVQVYVDDIIFGSTKKELCTAFEKSMHEKFQMSSMGELMFFLGVQVQQKKDGIFISQDKYVVENLKKFGSMIGSLMYLTSSRPDIMFAMRACARYQVNLKVSHLHAVKRIFIYLKGQPKLGLWYPKDSPFDLVAYIDSNYAGASVDRKSTTGGCQFLRCRLISWQCKKQTVVTNSTPEAEYVAASSCVDNCFGFKINYLIMGKAKKCVRLMMEKLFRMELELILFWSTVKAKTINGEVQLHALVDGEKIIVIESTVRRDLQLEDAEGIDCLPNSTILEELTRIGSKTTAWNEFSSTMASTIICLATNQKFNFSKYIFESMVRNLDNVSGKFLMYPRKPKRKDTQVPQPSSPTNIVADEAVHKELGDILVRAATTASILEAEQDSGAKKPRGIQLLKLGLRTYLNFSMIHCSQEKRVKKLEQKKSSRTHGLKRHDADNEMFDVDTLNDDEVFVAEQEVAAKDVNLTIDEVTLAQALAALKSVKPKVKGDVIEEPSVRVSAASASIKVKRDLHNNHHKQGKGKMIEPEPVKPKKKDVQIMLDEEAAKKLQAEEQEELSVEEKATLFQQLLEKRRKHFATNRVEEQRNKPPTQAQQRKIMCTYLKNMEGKKLKDLKNKSFDSIKKMFDKAF